MYSWARRMSFPQMNSIATPLGALRSGEAVVLVIVLIWKKAGKALTPGAEWYNIANVVQFLTGLR